MKFIKQKYLTIIVSIVGGIIFGLILTFGLNAFGAATSILSTTLKTLSLNIGYGAIFNNLSSSDSEKVIITNTGNIGIGTITPTAKLEVAGGDNSFAWGGDNSANGYIRMGNMQICWGNGDATNSSQPYYVAYSAVTFPNGCIFNNITYSLVANTINTSNNGKAFTQVGPGNSANPRPITKSTTGATIYFHKISDGDQEAATATGNVPFIWIAIGTWQ